MPNRHQIQALTPPGGKLPKDSQSPPKAADSPPIQARAACTECSRRKQKCNREWPCNHCKKRRVADKCSFTHETTPGGPRTGSSGLQESKRKRDADAEAHDDDEPADEPVQYGGSAFEALGYSPAHLFAGLATRQERPSRSQQSKTYLRTPDACPQLARALKVLPPRPYTDLLVQNFLGHVNDHYYIIYPRDFLKEYRDWWRDRVDDKPLRLQWTCLLIMICACSLQFTQPDLEQMLEADLGQSMQRLSESYHSAARELYAVIPVGHSHIHSVQQLLHSCYWYMSEGRFVESWHVLATAIHQAQELRFDQERLAGPTSEFEREMRRGLWSIMNTWDWQTASILGRSMIIDRNACDVQLPSLNLEESDPPPLLHVKYHSELVNHVSEAFGLVKYITAGGDIEEYHRILDEWIASLPRWYAWQDPDTSQDQERPCIQLHRHCIRVVGSSMALEPVRSYLTNDMAEEALPEELQARSTGIDHCLKLMQALRDLFNFVFPRSAKFHLLGFTLFDTAAIMCSAVLHDKGNSLQRKQEVLGNIEEAISMLGRLSAVTPSAQTSYQLLLTIAAQVKSRRGIVEPSGRSHIKAEPNPSALMMTASVPEIPVDSRTKDLSAHQNQLFNASSAAQAQQLATPGPSPWSFPYSGGEDKMYPGMQGYHSGLTLPDLGPPSLPLLSGFQMSYGINATDYLHMPDPRELPQAYHSTMTYQHSTTMQIEAGQTKDIGGQASTWQYRTLNLDSMDPNG